MIAADSGLGYLILDAQAMSRSDKVFIGILTIGAWAFCWMGSLRQWKGGCSVGCAEAGPYYQNLRCPGGAPGPFPGSFAPGMYGDPGEKRLREDHPAAHPGRLETPDAGTVEKPAGLKLGMMFQEARLFPWLTCRENIALGLPKGADPGETDTGWTWSS